MSVSGARATSLLAAATVVACGGGGSDGGGGSAPPEAGGACSVAEEKDFVRRAAGEWYLFLDLLPAAIDPNAHATADDLLNALTAVARAQGRDRYFSYITTISEEQQFFAAGQAVGYLNLRTFISPADAALRSAFEGFAAENVRDLIVDLRYNGGGAVATAELLGNLLLAGQTNQILYRTRLNPNKSASEETVRVRAETGALPAQRIAFLTLSGTASASELVINVLAPYAEVAIVGTRTYGKPVGQYAFDLSSSCDMRLRLVTFRMTNRNDYGDYYDGLPDAAAQVPDAFCAAADDLTRAQGDGEEGLTRAALHWLSNGGCPAPPPGEAKAALAAADLYPRPRAAAPFQIAAAGAF